MKNLQQIYRKLSTELLTYQINRSKLSSPILVFNKSQRIILWFVRNTIRIESLRKFSRVSINKLVQFHCEVLAGLKSHEINLPILSSLFFQFSKSLEGKHRVCWTTCDQDIFQFCLSPFSTCSLSLLLWASLAITSIKKKPNKNQSCHPAEAAFSSRRD